MDAVGNGGNLGTQAQTPVEILEATFADFKMNQVKCTVQDLDGMLKAVEYPRRLAAVCAYCEQGYVLGCLVPNGHLDYIRCILSHIEPCDLVHVCLLTGDCKRTILHSASAHNKPELIKLLNELLKMKDWLQLLSVPDASGATVLDHAAPEGLPIKESIVEAVLHGLTLAQQHSLLKQARTLQKVASESDLSKIMTRVNSSAETDSLDFGCGDGSIQQNSNQEANISFPAKGDGNSLDINQELHSLDSSQSHDLLAMNDAPEMILELQQETDGSDSNQSQGENAAVENQLLAFKESVWEKFRGIEVELAEKSSQLEQLQTMRMKVEAQEKKLKDQEQELHELRQWKNMMTNRVSKLAESEREFEKTRPAIEQIIESEIISQVDAISKSVRDCQGWNEVFDDIDLAEGGQDADGGNDGGGNEAAGVDPPPRNLEEKVHALEKCVKKLNAGIKDLRFRCKFLSNGKADTASTRRGLALSPNTSYLSIPPEDSRRSSTSDSTSRSNSFDNLLSPPISHEHLSTVSVTNQDHS